MTTYFVNQRARIETTVKDTAGVLTNATVTCTLTKPDGTTSSPSITNVSTGLYRVEPDLDQSGLWRVTWRATGAVIAGEPERFYVYPATDTWLVSLSEAKAHLNETATTNDDELKPFVAAASEFVENIVGAVARQTITDEVVHPDPDGFVWLKHPAISLTTITQTYGGTKSYVAATVTTDSPELTRGKLWLGGSYTSAYPLKVTYVAGRVQVPTLIRSAVLDYLKWDWQSQRGAGPLPYSTSEEMAAVPGTVPFKIRQKLSAYTIPGIA